eukprot:6482836-Amphidinium_carterae.1
MLLTIIESHDAHNYNKGQCITVMHLRLPPGTEATKQSSPTCTQEAAQTQNITNEKSPDVL